MKNKILKKAYLILALITFLYIIICVLLMRFSISVFIYFMTAVALFLGLYYTEKFPINPEEDEPSAVHIFIKISSLLFFGITIMLILFNIMYVKPKLPNDQKYDYIIVFGAGITGKNEIINSRIDNAITYAKKYDRCRFVLTGAKGTDEPIEEAYYMMKYMVDRGVREDRIIVEPFSVNTYQNISNSLELIKEDIKRRNARDRIIKRPFISRKGVYDLDFINIGFMSSEFHMTRIVMMAKKAGINSAYSIPCATRPLYVVYMYIRENLSLFKSFVLSQVKL